MFVGDDVKLKNIELWKKFRNKVENNDLYLLVRDIHDDFLTNNNLDMLNHKLDSQKNKAIHKSFTKVVPKSIVFS